MVFRNNKAHLPVAFEDGAKFHRLEPNSTVQYTVEGEIKNKKIEKRRPTTVVTGPGGGPGDIKKKGAGLKKNTRTERIQPSVFTAKEVSYPSTLLSIASEVLNVAALFTETCN